MTRFSDDPPGTILNPYGPGEDLLDPASETSASFEPWEDLGTSSSRRLIIFNFKKLPGPIFTDTATATELRLLETSLAHL